MWLLDENLPTGLHAFLQQNGIRAESVQFRGWKGLSNGNLVNAASAAGFSCILTLDQAFAEAAAQALTGTDFAVVLVRFTGRNQSQISSWFKSNFETNPIRPASGRLIEWPD